MTTTPEPESIVVLDATTSATRELLGGKAWGIQRMMALGIPVPPAFVVTTDVCRRFHHTPATLPADVWGGVPAAMAALESRTERRFGGGARPLLVSVRSGAAASMPGMMDTVLDLGMTDSVELALAEHTGDPAFAADTRRRFRAQFQKVVGFAPPEDPWEQLRLAISAVLDSWNSRRANSYRESRGLPHTDGTAITVQAMVFGNLDDRSGTGVLFTRNPLSGSAEPYGEWLPRGQGEDVVSGRADALALPVLAATMPQVHADLLAAAERLEADARDVQNIEFTVQSATLWLLQTRAATRSPTATVRHAAVLHRAGLITGTEALDRVRPDHLQALFTPHLDQSAVATATRVATGKPACPGIATGTVVLDAAAAQERVDRGEAVVFARPTTDPEDVAVMSVAAAVITELGGSTSHAAVVCRELGVPCVVGCGSGTFAALAGRTVTVDATSGITYSGELTVLPAPTTDDPDVLLLTSLAREEAMAELNDSLLGLLARRNGKQSE
ncbi:pyruvate, phosphate dikinase [Nocardia callitridis]|uniref:Pyruvate, phosphate dikinase n=1 Tax=Nocardia callitridis TaxID=648753 RepID=A0ABP9KR63_9NOCA